MFNVWKAGGKATILELNNNQHLHNPFSPNFIMSIISKLTPWNRVLFEKLTVSQLVKEFLRLLWNPNIYYRVHKSPPLVPVFQKFLKLCNIVTPFSSACRYMSQQYAKCYQLLLNTGSERTTYKRKSYGRTNFGSIYKTLYDRGVICSHRFRRITRTGIPQLIDIN
jgi:hypothetical protein